MTSNCVFIVTQDGDKYLYSCPNCSQPSVVHDSHCKLRRNCTTLLLGDRIAGYTKAVGIEPCVTCEERREKLNNWQTQRNIKRKESTEANNGPI